MMRLGRKGYKKLAVAGFLTALVYIMSKRSLLLQALINGSNPSSRINHEAFLVDMPSCKIPKIDPYDKSIYHIVRKTGSRVCSSTVALTYDMKDILYVNWTAAEAPPYNGDILYCTYIPLFRPKYAPTHKDFLRYLPESEPFNDSITISHDFVKVYCYDTNDTVAYVNFHSFIPRNITVEKINKEKFVRHAVNNKITERLNVMMIGIDSVSRLSFLRQMVKTRKFLTETLGAVDMMGYNKVADNTFVNIVPMTLGKYVQEMPWNESKANVPFDKFNFIWKEYSQNGYRTFYAEDAPDISIFDFLKAGFETPPADYFNRPVSLAMEMKRELWDKTHHCFQDRLETQIVLDYLHKFVQSHKNEPFFAFTFITRLTHEDINNAGAADGPYFNFFSKLHQEGLLANTVLLFFSDHGMRFGKIRDSFVGKLEERLPFMYMAVPKWLRDAYPFLEKNLRTNEHRLSTPFDVYETLKDVLYFDGVEKKVESSARGVSWFREIPNTRSCDSAGILPHWCTCVQHENLNPSDPLVTKAAFMVLSDIINSLKTYTNICEHLELVKVKEASRLVESDQVLKFIRSENDVQNRREYFGDRTKPQEDIQVVIVTTPGEAVFEATVRYDTVQDTFKVMGDISRINIYGHQSDCMPRFHLKKFCQCRNLET